MPPGGSRRRTLAAGTLALALAGPACSAQPDLSKITQVPTINPDRGLPQVQGGGNGTLVDPNGDLGDPNAPGGPGHGPIAVPGGPVPVFGAAPGMSLMVSDGSSCVTYSAQGVALATCDGSTGQRWEMLRGGIQSLAGTLCLSAQPTEGAALGIASCSPQTDAGQQLTFSLGYMFSAGTMGDASMCLGAAAGAPDKLAMHSCTANNGLQFILGWDGVQMSPTGKVTQCVEGAGTSVRNVTCSDASLGQAWTFYGSGQMMIQRLKLCLDVAGGNATANAGLALAPCDGTRATQQWSWVSPDSTVRPQGASSLFVAVASGGQLYLSASVQQGWTFNK